LSNARRRRIANVDGSRPAGGRLIADGRAL